MYSIDKVDGKSKNLTKITDSVKVLRDKAFEISGKPKYVMVMVYKFFDKKSSGSGVTTVPNHQLVNEPHRQIVRNNKRKKV